MTEPGATILLTGGAGYVGAATADALLAADGAEIIAAINEQPGAWVKPLLEELLQEVAHGRVENRRDALAAAAKQLHEKR